MDGLQLGWGVPFSKRYTDWLFAIGLAALAVDAWMVLQLGPRETFLLRGTMAWTLQPFIAQPGGIATAFAYVTAALVCSLSALAIVMVVLGVPFLIISTARTLRGIAGLVAAIELIAALYPREGVALRWFVLAFCFALGARSIRAPLFGMSPLRLPDEPFHPEQKERYRTRRKRRVERARRKFPYVPSSHIAPLTLVQRFPLHAGFDLRYIAPYVPLILRFGWHFVYNRLLRRYLKCIGLSDQFGDYGALFTRLIPVPSVVRQFMTDEDFARFRVAGPHVLNLRRVARDDAEPLRSVFPGLPQAALDALLDRCVGEQPLREAIRRGEVYFIRYSILERAIGDRIDVYSREHEARKRFLPTPAALFHGTKNGLTPVAIRVDRTANRIYFPQDGVSWDAAKLFVQVADHNEHYLGTHLGMCHLLFEAISASVPRNLAYEHPIHVLLEPHLRYTLPANKPLKKLLSKPGGIYDDVFAADLDLMRKVIGEAKRSQPLRDIRPHNDLHARGLTDAPFEYPYRHDARELWEIIEQYVRASLVHFYPFEGFLHADHELIDWWDEICVRVDDSLRDPDAPHGLSLEALVALLSTILFMAGPGHAAAHFASFEHFSMVPAFPGAAYVSPAELDTLDTTGAFEIVSRMLPPFGSAIRQFELSHLGDHHFERFGDYRAYRVGYLRAPALVRARTSLRAHLKTLEDRILERNKRIEYRYLLPSRIPNSINV